MATHINPKVLSKFVVDYQPPEQKFIADEILTKVPVNQVSADYAIFAKYASKQSDDTIGYKSASTELDLQRTKDSGSYTTVPHGHKKLVHKRDQQAYKSWFDLVKENAYAIKRQLLLNKEIAFKTLIDAASYSTTPSTKWDAASPTIEDDISTGIDSFKTNAGIKPNTIIIPHSVWRVVAMDSTLRDIWKLVPNRSDQNIKLSSLISMLFDNFTKVLIPDVSYDTEGKNETESLSDLYSDTVSILYTVPSGTKNTFTWVTRFIYQDIKTEIWENPDKDIKGTWVKVSYEEDMKQVCSTAIYNLTDVLT
jgi:hypothetical protein